MVSGKGLAARDSTIRFAMSRNQCRCNYLRLSLSTRRVHRFGLLRLVMSRLIKLERHWPQSETRSAAAGE